jgi:golgi-specific brefeldin A-resistance guanine nucleotide exchange factor 1
VEGSAATGRHQDSVFHYVFGFSHNKEIYSIIWGPTLTALSFIFDKSLDGTVHAKSLRGFNKSAGIAAHYNLHEDFDALVLSLCKFTQLLNVADDAIDLSNSLIFATSAKAQLAMKCVFGLLHDNGDCMRESWKHAIDVIIQLFKMKLLSGSINACAEQRNGLLTLTSVRRFSFSQQHVW